jgi:hypothetical protein
LLLPDPADTTHKTLVWVRYGIEGSGQELAPTLIDIWCVGPKPKFRPKIVRVDCPEVGFTEAIKSLMTGPLYVNNMECEPDARATVTATGSWIPAPGGAVNKSWLDWGKEAGLIAQFSFPMVAEISCKSSLLPKFAPKMVIKKLPLVGLCNGTLAVETFGVSYENTPATVPRLPAIVKNIAASMPILAGMMHVSSVCEIDSTFAARRARGWRLTEVTIETIISEETVPKLFPKMVIENEPLVVPCKGVTCVIIGLFQRMLWPERVLSPSTSK